MGKLRDAMTLRRRGREEGSVSSDADAALVLSAASGDKDAYRVLVERYENRLFSVAFDVVKNREDARDIVQEAFIKAYLSLGRFRGQSSFYTWIYRIVLNLSIDWRRKMLRRGGPALDLDEGRTADRKEHTTPLDVVFRKEQSEHIQRVLSQISEDHRRVILLREIEGMSYDEIAETLNISIGTVMSRLFYARKKLQAALEEFSPENRLSAENERTAENKDS